LLPDDLIRPEQGHATVFAAYGEKGRAEQAIFHAHLLPLFQRKDWDLARIEPKSPLAIPRLTAAQSPATRPSAPAGSESDLARNVAEGIAHSLGRRG
jgi:hypothetical protein